MEENSYHDTDVPSGQMDVLKYSKGVSLILGISMAVNFLLAAGTLGIAGLIFSRFREFPMIVQQDNGYLEPHEAGLFILNTEHVRAFLERTLGTLRSYDCDMPDFSFIENFVEEKVITGVEKETKDSLDKARKFNRRQMWQLVDFRRSYDSKFSSRMIAVVVNADLMNYENSRITSKFRVLEVKPSKDYLVAFLVRVPVTRKNPWGLVLANFYTIEEPSKFEKLWKESVDPHAPEFDPNSEDFRERFSWSTSWKPRKRKAASEDNL